MNQPGGREGRRGGGENRKGEKRGQHHLVNQPGGREGGGENRKGEEDRERKGREERGGRNEE